MSNLSIAEAIGIAKEHTGANVNSVGATLFIQKKIDQGERVALQNRLDLQSIEVLEESERTKVDL